VHKTCRHSNRDERCASILLSSAMRSSALSGALIGQRVACSLLRSCYTSAPVRVPAACCLRSAHSAACETATRQELKPASPANVHKYLVLEYKYDVTDTAALETRRAPLRPAHLAHAQAAAAAGNLMLGGAWAAAPFGGMLLFRGLERERVERFAQEDPYVTGGLVSGFTVREWNVVVDGFHTQ